MKKAYINPALEVVTIATRRGLLFASGEGDNLNGGGSKGNYSGSGQLGREFSFTEDE